MRWDLRVKEWLHQNDFLIGSCGSRCEFSASTPCTRLGCCLLPHFPTTTDFCSSGTRCQTNPFFWKLHESLWFITATEKLVIQWVNLFFHDLLHHPTPKAVGPISYALERPKLRAKISLAILKDVHLSYFVTGKED